MYIVLENSWEQGPRCTVTSLHCFWAGLASQMSSGNHDDQINTLKFSFTLTSLFIIFYLPTCLWWLVISNNKETVITYCNSSSMKMDVALVDPTLLGCQRLCWPHSTYTKSATSIHIIKVNETFLSGSRRQLVLGGGWKLTWPTDFINTGKSYLTNNWGRIMKAEDYSVAQTDDKV